MVSRFNYYFTYFALGFGILLILTGNRYTDYINVHQTSIKQWTLTNFLKSEGFSSNTVEPMPVNPKDGFANIEEILEKTRKEIKSKLKNYNFSHSDGRKLEDLLLESSGKPIRNIILSTWRSGTTFLGELLNAVPGNFYHYEPLLRYKTNVIKGPPLAVHAVNSLKNMLKCEYKDMKQYFNYGKKNLIQFNHNTRLWKYCKHKTELCVDANFTSAFCKLFPFQSMKLVRLRLHLVEDLLKDIELNAKVVLLIRDPRGVLQSRQFRNWCRRAPDCWEPKRLCGDMESDYNAAGMLINKYPDRVVVLRYEELALFPEVTTNQLFSFLRIHPSKSVWKFIYKHTNMEVDGVSSTYRVSREMPFRWKTVLDFDFVDKIQKVCKEAMEIWGYRLAQNSSHLRSDDFFPLESWAMRS